MKHNTNYMKVIKKLWKLSKTTQNSKIITNFTKSVKNNKTKMFKSNFCFANDLFLKTTSEQLSICSSDFVYNPFYVFWMMADICYDNLWRS